MENSNFWHFIQEFMDLHKVFVYGTLKQDEPNHYMLQNGGPDLEDFKSSKNQTFQPAKFICKAETLQKYPLVIASKFNIPYLLDKPGTGHQIQGEIYQIDDLLLKILDDFEGHPNYYLRRKESVMHLSTDAAKAEKCWTYFLPKFKVELLELQFLSDYR